uniref:Secreted peptide n=1 Tax=Rhipicephalus pulchellus TaxID=72859 RepID=L7LX18_RHIPC
MLTRIHSLGAPTYWTAMFHVFHALSLYALVVHGIDDNEIVGTVPISNPGAVTKPCKISYITNQANASVVKNCTCEVTAEDNHINEISRPSHPNAGNVYTHHQSFSLTVYISPFTQYRHYWGRLVLSVKFCGRREPIRAYTVTNRMLSWIHCHYLSRIGSNEELNSCDSQSYWAEAIHVQLPALL